MVLHFRQPFFVCGLKILKKMANGFLGLGHSTPESENLQIVVGLQVNDPQSIHHQHHRIGWVQFKPTDSKIGPSAELVVVVVVAFPHH